jgi:hypothetical protein
VSLSVIVQSCSMVQLLTLELSSRHPIGIFSNRPVVTFGADESSGSYQVPPEADRKSPYNAKVEISRK